MGTINYSSSADIILIEVKDYSGAKLDSFKCPVNDKKKYSQILSYLKDKYGFEPEIKPDKSVAAMNHAREERIEWWD